MRKILKIYRKIKGYLAHKDFTGPSSIKWPTTTIKAATPLKPSNATNL